MIFALAQLCLRSSISLVEQIYSYSQRDDIGLVWLSYTIDWTSMPISNGKIASSL